MVFGLCLRVCATSARKYPCMLIWFQLYLFWSVSLYFCTSCLIALFWFPPQTCSHSRLVHASILYRISQHIFNNLDVNFLLSGLARASEESKKKPLQKHYHSSLVRGFVYLFICSYLAISVAVYTWLYYSMISI